MKYITRSILIAFVVGIFIATPLSVPQNAHAQFTELNGAKVSTYWYCTCTPGCFLLTLGYGPNPGLFMYCPWTQLYSYYNIFSGWQLGGDTGEMTCMMYAVTGCYAQGAGPVMVMNGTSAY